MDIKEARDNLLKVMDSINKDKLSLHELKTYAEILKTASEIQVKSFSDYMETINSSLGLACPKSATVGEMKGDVSDGV